MAATKVTTVLDNSITLTAGSGNHTSSVWDVHTGYGGTLNIKITNGATGPTVAAQSQVQVSEDNSNWYNLGGALVASVTNSAVTSWTINIPIGVQYVQVISGSNTGQNVTLRVEGSLVTALS